mmetsp:Transcript_165365/g.530719  ORF Transcript_165365/g.530719 Transcript_165365/m.530719 type:complete len:233 (-) Transcript_165365:1029-1727(-)
MALAPRGLPQAPRRPKSWRQLPRRRWRALRSTPMLWTGCWTPRTPRAYQGGRRPFRPLARDPRRRLPAHGSARPQPQSWPRRNSTVTASSPLAPRPASSATCTAPRLWPRLCSAATASNPSARGVRGRRMRIGTCRLFTRRRRSRGGTGRICSRKCKSWSAGTPGGRRARPRSPARRAFSWAAQGGPRSARAAPAAGSRGPRPGAPRRRHTAWRCRRRRQRRGATAGSSSRK